MQELGEIVRATIKLWLGKGVRNAYSQFGEDAVIQNFFRERKGFYVDVGAYHPILYSNTYALYRKGWRGIVIDPNPRCKALFRWFRPNDTFVRTAVGEANESIYYEYDDAACNAVGTPAPARKDLKLIRKTPIRVQPLSEILRGVEHIDFMNIDVEGMDTAVLRTHDWHSKPTVIAIEGHIGDASYEFLLAKGYELKGLAGVTMIFKLRT